MLRHLRLLLPLVLIPAAAAQGDDPWVLEAREFLQTHPEDAGLGVLVEALDVFDLDAARPHGETLRAIAETGWSGEHPEITSLIEGQATALAWATVAAGAVSMEFPEPQDIHSALPNTLELRLLMRLMVADARRQEAAGDPAAAAERSVRALRLANHLCAERTTLYQHLIGLSEMRLSCMALESALRHPGLDESALRSASSEIAWVQRHHRAITPTFATERRIVVSAVREMQGNPALQEQFLPEHEARNLTAAQRATVAFWIASPEAFEAAARPVWEEILANASRPPWEREVMDGAWLIQRVNGPVPGMHFPNFDQAFARDDVAVAHLALCQALCALRLGDDAALRNAIDPFTGQPVIVTADRVHSVGPDKRDEQGALVYDPTNGALSVGDIVAPR
jgi:hypothetical protein